MSFVQTETLGNYAIIALKREPVNSLNTEFWKQLASAFTELERTAEVRGVIFTSGLTRPVFTAGNDISELYAPRTSLEQYRKFWLLSNGFLAQVYRSRMITISAIKGACPAGGCCLSLCCDVRIMTDFGHIGLNEVALGIPVPTYWAHLMARVIGEGAAQTLCLSATLASPQEALKLGLIDEVVSKEDLLKLSKEKMQQLLALPDSGRAATKAAFRDGFAKDWVAFSQTEPDWAWKSLSAPETIRVLDAYLSKLKSKKSKL